MRFRILLLLLATLIAATALPRANTTLAADKTTARTPVIVELFTSEGCSSCPPADALLRKLESEQPVPNAEIIVLGEHVDYWNYIGWTDRFSSKQFTQRQEGYARIFNLDSAYTPQMVVNGGTELNGADDRAAKHAIADAARRPRASVELSLSDSGRDLTVKIAPSPSAKNAEVFLALTESDLKTEVKKGENDGRTLVHTGVVRELKKIGELTPQGFSATAPLQIEPSWKRAALTAVVFVQEKQNRRILGVAAVKLSN